MKKILLLFSFALFFISCTKTKQERVIAENSHSDYKILIIANADSLTQRAAQELQNYIFKVSDAKLKIVNELSQADKFITIGRDFIVDSSLISKLDTIKEDGFVIETAGNNIFISGNNGKSNLYATYSFIEEFLGCRLLSSTEEYVPQVKTLNIPNINKTYEPSFSFRRILFKGMYNEKYKYWHKIEPLDEWGSFVHTFQILMPPERYFKNHPEYFALVNNRRLSDAQLCLSNPEVINTLKENLRAEIEKNPSKKYWSVSQNDCYNYCECEDCKAMYKKYGSVSGAYIHMANELAKEFPDKQISTLAYQFTRSAPTNIIPLKNVNIMFCSIECNRSKPISQDIRSQDFVTDMKNWSKLTNNIFLWDYVVQFKNYLTPFPNFHVLQPNIQFFSENNVNMMFQQGSGERWSDLSDLKQYLISKLLWNKDADVDSIVNDFMHYYYGPAEPFIKSYYELTHKAIKENSDKENLNIYGFPMDYIDSYLTPSLLKQYKEIMDQAEASVKNDSVYLKRVQKTRLPVDFAYLDIALNYNNDGISYLMKTGDSISIRPEMLEYLNRFVQLSKETSATIINERGFSTEEYKAYVLKKLGRMTKVNLAKNKTIKSLTKYSDEYPVGGVKALTDGLFGDLDYHNNWLGYHGQDMIVEIDLNNTETVKEVSMNFLKAVNSWVFLPKEISIEVSKDGKNYLTVGSAKGDVTDENYLVKSIPFDIKFTPIKTQYIRITAKSLKQCPKWHRGFGKASWIFIDEIIVE